MNAHGHSHSSAAEAEIRIEWRRGLALTSLAMFVIALVAAALLWPSEERVEELRDQVSDAIGLSESFPAATVLDSRAGTCIDAPVECQLLTVRIDEGPDAGEQFVLEIPEGTTVPDLEAGDEIVLAQVGTEGELRFRYQYSDQQRRPVLWMLFGLFAAAVVALGLGRGVGALAGLILSLGVVVVFLVPAILAGEPPVVVAVTAAVLAAFVALYLAHGLHVATRLAFLLIAFAAWASAGGSFWLGVVCGVLALVVLAIRFTPLGGVHPRLLWFRGRDNATQLAMTHVALLGTVLALIAIVVLASIFTSLAQFQGFFDDETSLLFLAAPSISLSSLILAGMVIAALGALDDVTVTQASATFELRSADPSASRASLFRSSLKIGRDHVASVVNTLALAYVGSALPLVLLFTLSRQSFGAFANSEAVAVEIVGALVGSIGLVLAVPITTAMAATIAAPAVAVPADVAHDTIAGDARPEDAETPPSS